MEKFRFKIFPHCNNHIRSLHQPNNNRPLLQSNIGKIKIPALDKKMIQEMDKLALGLL